MRAIYTTAAYWSWMVLLLVWLLGYFLRKLILIRVSDEDALMAGEFPAAHRDYRARTKALIPFVW